MADSYSVAVKAQATVTETLGATDDLLFASAANRKTIHDQFNKTVTLSGTSTPPVTKVVSFRKALVAGTGQIDLNVLTGTHGASVDGAGLKVQFVLAQAASGNAGVLTLTEGAATGYKLASVASWKLGLSPGGAAVWVNGADTGDDVTTGVTDLIDLAGNGTDSVDLTIGMG